MTITLCGFIRLWSERQLLSNDLELDIPGFILPLQGSSAIFINLLMPRSLNDDASWRNREFERLTTNEEKLRSWGEIEWLLHVAPIQMTSFRIHSHILQITQKDNARR